MKTYIVGNGGFAVEVLEWLTAASFNSKFEGFVVAPGSVERSLSNCPCIDEDALPRNEKIAIYFAIGSPTIRRKVVANLKSKYPSSVFPNLIHPTALISETAELGEGNLFMPYSIVCPWVKIGSFNVLNLYASLGHEAELASFCTLSPYATLNGCSSCGDAVFIGSHATVASNIKICNFATLSANSLATKSIPENALAFGVPAKFLKETTKVVVNG